MRPDGDTLLEETCPEPGMGACGLQVEGEDGQPLEQGLHERFAATAAGFALGPVHAVEELRRGDRGYGHVFATEGSGKARQVEGAPLDGDEHARIDQRSQGEGGSAGCRAAAFATASQ